MGWGGGGVGRNFHSSPNIVIVRVDKFVGHVAHVRAMKPACRMMVRKFEWKRPLGKLVMDRRIVFKHFLSR